MHLLIFPHQLFRDHPALKLKPARITLIEDSLFFGDAKYPARFHKKKLWLHRTTMKRYQAWLKEKGFTTNYIDHVAGQSVADHLERLTGNGKGAKTKPKNFITLDPTDFVLEKRLRRACRRLNGAIEFLPNPGFINRPEENQEYRASKKRWFMADFYKWQRRRLNLLMDGDQPVGGKWSFDEDNRKKGAQEIARVNSREPEA